MNVGTGAPSGKRKICKPPIPSKVRHTSTFCAAWRLASALNRTPGFGIIKIRSLRYSDVGELCSCARPFACPSQRPKRNRAPWPTQTGNLPIKHAEKNRFVRLGEWCDMAASFNSRPEGGTPWRKRKARRSSGSAVSVPAFFRERPRRARREQQEARGDGEDADRRRLTFDARQVCRAAERDRHGRKWNG